MLSSLGQFLAKLEKTGAPMSQEDAKSPEGLVLNRFGPNFFDLRVPPGFGKRQLKRHPLCSTSSSRAEVAKRSVDSVSCWKLEDGLKNDVHAWSLLHWNTVTDSTHSVLLASLFRCFNLTSIHIQATMTWHRQVTSIITMETISSNLHCTPITSPFQRLGRDTRNHGSLAIPWNPK